MATYYIDLANGRDEYCMDYIETFREIYPE